MQNHKLKIQKNSKKQDLTIIYKESKDNIHEMKAFKDSIFGSLRYFQRKSNEINLTNLIYIEENVPFDLFEAFILSTSSDELDINDSNYEKFYYFACKYEYQELKDEIEKFINTRPDIQNILTQIIDKKDDFEQIYSNNEELICKNLDISIKTGLLNQIPLNSLVRILNSPKRVIKDNHLLFSFVVSIIKKFSMNENMDENVTANLSLLIASLDYCSMSSEEIEEIFSIDKIDLAFSPRNAEKRIKMFIEEEKEMKSKISNLEEKINQNEENCNQRIKKLEEKYNKKISDLENKINQNEENYNKRIKKLEENYNKKISDLENKINQNEENYNQRVKNLEDNYNKKISDLENKINQNEENYNKKIKNIEDILKDSIEIKIAQLEKSNEKIIKSTLPNDKNIKSFSPKNCNDFDGIFDFLTKKTGSNIHDSKIIEITSNSALNGHHPKFLLETYTSYATLAGEKYAWVCFDFINMKIEITEYKIDASYSCPIKNWVLEVSNDKNNWKTIDTHSNDEIFKGSIKIQTFKVQKNDFSRYCRIRHTGEFCDYSSGSHMHIHRIEFYGKLEIHD